MQLALTPQVLLLVPATLDSSATESHAPHQPWTNAHWVQTTVTQTLPALTPQQLSLASATQVT